MDWTKEISILQIPSSHMQMIASTCGIEDAVSLMSKLPGIQIYVPMAGRKRLNQKYVKENFDGFNASLLAIKLKITREKVISFSKTELNEELTSNFYMRTVKDHCGEPVAIRLMTHFPTYRFYIPQNGFSLVRRKYIEEHFTGFNTTELALKCHVSERHVQAIIADMYAKSAQTDLFSDLKF
jgi:Mor family transcriptional regulator